jgi:hypothetical protein
MCTIARLAPRSDSNVRSIRCSRHLREHLDGDVVGDQVLLDELADEVEVGLAGRREADLDLLVAHLYEQVNIRRLRSGTSDR